MPFLFSPFFNGHFKLTRAASFRFFAFAAISNEKFNIYFMKPMPLAARVTRSDSDTFLEYFLFLEYLYNATTVWEWTGRLGETQ